MDRPVAPSKPPSPAALGHVEAWVFDLDNTLYPVTCNLFAQIDARIQGFMARFLDIGPEEARRVQKRYFREYGTTLSGLMKRHGLDPREYLEHVHTIDLSPIQPSPGLDAALGRLRGRKIIFTNADVGHASRVMERLGVTHHFESIFDIVAADYVPKPEPEVYASLVRRHDLDPARTVMFEDIARNLLPAAELGMTTVWLTSPSALGREGADGDHIHHVADDLVGWLEAVSA